MNFLSVFIFKLWIWFKLNFQIKKLICFFSKGSTRFQIENGIYVIFTYLREVIKSKNSTAPGPKTYPQKYMNISINIYLYRIKTFYLQYWTWRKEHFYASIKIYFYLISVKFFWVWRNVRLTPQPKNIFMLRTNRTINSN